MKITMNFSDFIDQWPESRKDQFSYQGKKALFDYLEEYTESTGEEVEFDPIALCCDYTEYDNLEDILKDYNNIKDLADLESHTTVLPLENGRYIIQQF